MRWHLVALVLSVLLPTLVFAGMLTWRSAMTERARVEARAADAARELAASLDRSLTDVLASARVLAGSESLAAGDLAAFHRRASEVQRELGAANVSVRDAASRPLVNTGTPWGAPLPDAAPLAPADRRVEATGLPAISAVYQGPGTARLLFAVVVPLPAGAEGAGPRFLSLAMPLDRIQRILERDITLPDGMVAGVTDGAGRLIARSVAPEAAVGRMAPNQVPRTPDAPRSGMLMGVSLGGERTLLAWRLSDLTGWRVGVTVPLRALMAAERRALFWIGVLGIGALALGLGAALLFARRLTGAVTSLAEAGAALGVGDAVRPVATPLQEANQVAAALREGAERLARVQRIGRVGGFEINLRSQYSQRSTGYLTLQGLPAGTVSWRHSDWVARLHPEDRAGAEARFLDAVSDHSGATDYAQEYRIVTPTGEVRWISARAEIERDPVTGAALRMMGAHVDVTDLKRVEAARAEAEERLRLAVEAAQIGFWDHDVPGDRLIWSPRVRALFGFGPEEPVDVAAFLSAVHAEDRPLVEAASTAALDPTASQPIDVEFRIHRRSDGSLRWVAVKGAALFDGEGRCLRMLGTTMDITARKGAENRLRRVLDGLFTFVGLTTPQGILVEANAAPLRVAGLTHGDVIGRPFWEAAWWTHDTAVVDRLRGAIARAAEGETVRYDVTIRVLGGALVTIDFQIAPLRDEAGRITHLVPSGVPVEERVQAERRLRELNNDLEALVERRSRDLRDTQERLAHAQRMEALGQLAGGIAHDFNNVLQAVSGGAMLLGRRAEDAEAVRRIARMVAEAAERGSAVTRRLLAFSRRGDLRAEAVRLEALLPGVQEVLAHTLGSGIEVTLTIEPDLPAALADKGQLETVLVNLATNARDAMNGQGRLVLAAALDDVAAAGPAGLPAGRYIRLTVRDTGAGMSPEVLARSTEPFFTTKPTGQGTGLGLAMAKGFAEQSGGALAIESAPGEGTAVSLWLPVALGRTRPVVLPGGPDDGPSGRYRVLLVDDEAAVRELTCAALEALGFAVLPAGGTDEALALLASGEMVDILLSDLSMPGRDGLALIAEAQRRRPDLPAILLTGFATGAVERTAILEAGGAFTLLRKPVEPALLADRILAMLDAAASGDRAQHGATAMQSGG
ncbi:MAG: PAS domain-containing protein [Acetobacteraceae bacterium]|nr:PAS domain-containing protein [Acetobacteraceae bacterium]